MNDSTNIDRSLPSLNDNKLVSLVLYGRDTFDNKICRKILNCNLKFNNNRHRFDKFLISNYLLLC